MLDKERIVIQNYGNINVTNFMIIGIGIDLAEVRRIEKLLGRPARFVRQIFTAGEIRYCEKKKSPAESYAAQFAAKEAFLKAIGTGWGTAQSPKWTEIEIVSKSAGSSPALKLSGKAQIIARELGVNKTHISLTHTREYAMALVILEGE